MKILCLGCFYLGQSPAELTLKREERDAKMSEPYERVKGGRLTFKGGSLATRCKDIDKKKLKKKKKLKSWNEDGEDVGLSENPSPVNDALGSGSGTGEIYTIDAAKKMKYDELFPVESRKFGYDPNAKVKTVEEALDDRVKKKADRYCK